MDLERADRLAAEQHNAAAKARDAIALLQQIGYEWRPELGMWKPKPLKNSRVHPNFEQWHADNAARLLRERR